MNRTKEPRHISELLKEYFETINNEQDKDSDTPLSEKTFVKKGDVKHV